MPASAVSNTLFNDGLNGVKNTVDKIVLLNAEPSSLSDADTLDSNGGAKLSDLPISASELSIQDDGSGGRELVIPKKGHIAEEGGSISHLALIKEGSELICYTEHDDGNGNAVSVTADLAYNIQQTTITIQDLVTS